MWTRRRLARRSGREDRRALAGNRPHAVGPQLRDALREKGRQSPLIFITAHELEMVEQDLGMETVLLKPLEADVLVHAIDAAISSFMARRNHRSRLARR